MAKIKEIEIEVSSPEKQLLIGQIRMEAKINVLTDLVASMLLNGRTDLPKEEFFKKLDDSIKAHVVLLLEKLQGKETGTEEHSVF